MQLLPDEELEGTIFGASPPAIADLPIAR